MANLACPIFGGIPATGAIARTATNVRNGGRTPVAGIVHALTLLLITLFFGRGAGLIPMAALAAILVLVSWVQIYAIDGPFFFGAAEKFKETLGTLAGAPRALVLIMRQVSAIDSTGLHALKDMVGRFRDGGTAVLVVGLHAQPMVALERAGLLEVLGRDNLVGAIDEALERARALAPKA